MRNAVSPRKEHGTLLLRSKLIEETRKFFWSRGFIETDTSALVLSPGMEPHIRPIGAHDYRGRPAAFLHTSPEFAMKKILALKDGPDKIFQICKCYRQEPESTTHHPEFTMLEWYRTGSGFEAIMDDSEALFSHFFGTLPTQRKAAAFMRMSVEDAFRNFAGIELARFLPATPSSAREFSRAAHAKQFCTLEETHTWDDVFFLVMLNAIEPELEKLERPIILHTYPESQAALSNLFTDARGLKWAKRFEIYAGGFELANAFDELVDADAQRARFLRDMEIRKHHHGDENAENFIPQSPIDEEFLTALQSMPPSGGIALGIDRLVMYFSGAKDIRDVLWSRAHWKPQS